MNSNQIDWSGIRAAAVVIGVREAARRAAINLTPQESNRFVKRVLKRSEREGWVTQKNAALAKPLTEQAAQPLSSNVVTGSDATLSKLKEDANETKISLSKGLRKAAKHISKQTGQVLMAGANKVKHIVGAASQLHGWEQNSHGGSISLNILTGQAAVRINTKRQE